MLPGRVILAFLVCASAALFSQRAHADSPSSLVISGEEINLSASARSDTSSHNRYIILSIRVSARDGSLPAGLLFRRGRMDLGGFYQGALFWEQPYDFSGNPIQPVVKGVGGYKSGLNTCRISSQEILYEIVLGKEKLNLSNVDVSVVLADAKHETFTLGLKAVATDVSDTPVKAADGAGKGRLVVYRRKAGKGERKSSFTLTLHIDDIKREAVKPEGYLQYEMVAGRHHISLKNAWALSEPLDLDVQVSSGATTYLCVTSDAQRFLTVSKEEAVYDLRELAP